MMHDGHRRRMRPAPGVTSRLQVIAYRMDCDTPIVELCYDGVTITLTDVDAEDVAVRIRRALSLLPSSK